MRKCMYCQKPITRGQAHIGIGLPKGKRGIGYVYWHDGKCANADPLFGEVLGEKRYEDMEREERLSTKKRQSSRVHRARQRTRSKR